MKDCCIKDLRRTPLDKEGSKVLENIQLNILIENLIKLNYWEDPIEHPYWAQHPIAPLYKVSRWELDLWELLRLQICAVVCVAVLAAGISDRVAVLNFPQLYFSFMRARPDDGYLEESLEGLQLISGAVFEVTAVTAVTALLRPLPAKIVAWRSLDDPKLLLCNRMGFQLSGTSGAVLRLQQVTPQVRPQANNGVDQATFLKHAGNMHMTRV